VFSAPPRDKNSLGITFGKSFGNAKIFSVIGKVFIYLVFNAIRTCEYMPMPLRLSCFGKYYAVCRRNVQTIYRSSRAGQPQA
jgi:hypothetical protein